jgi:hypothetical protein
MTDVSHGTSVGFLPPPIESLQSQQIPCQYERTRRSTPALPRASFNVATSDVSIPLFAFAGWVVAAVAGAVVEACGLWTWGCCGTYE